jgi:hypothetical protein
MENTWWLELLKLGIFAFFVTGLLEVWKDIRDVKKTVGTKRGEAITRLLNFAVAAFACWAFDYGVISRVVEIGANARQGIASFVDYLGTASIVRLGAVAIFEKFSAVIATYKKQQKASQAPETTTETVTTTNIHEEKTKTT